MIMADELLEEFNARKLTIDMQIGLLRTGTDSRINTSSSQSLSVDIRHLSSCSSKLIHVRRICRQDLKQENKEVSSSDDSDSSTSNSSTTVKINRERREIARRRLVKERSSSFNTNEVCYNIHHYGRLISPSIPEGMAIEFHGTDDRSVSSVSDCCEEYAAFSYFDGSAVESFSEES